MLRKDVEKLGGKAYAGMIRPLHRTSEFRHPIVGFDTEYTSKKGELISYQLAHEGRTAFLTGRLDVDSLARECRKLIRTDATEVLLVTFWSLAELQFLPVVEEGYDWREYGTGSFDCTFMSERFKLALHVFDLARFFDRQSLAAVAAAFGKKKLEWDTKHVTRHALRSSLFREYAVHDAVLAAEILEDLRAEFRPYAVDPVVYRTAAGTAAAAFRRQHVTEDLRCDDNRIRLVGMRSCWGGRAEAFARGHFPQIFEYDLASAYPNAALVLGEMPHGKSWREVRTVREVSSYRGGLARVFFRFPKQARFPSLPVVTETAQLYPLSGVEWITFAEIEAAREQGASVRILEAWGYKKGTRVLSDFLQRVIAEREQATGAKRVALKLLANSLIGKFSQHVAKVDIEQLRKAAEDEGVSIEELLAMSTDERAALGIGTRVQLGSVFMPEWTALITGYVRAQLGRLIHAHPTVYCATDAIWTTERIVDPPPLLSLKREGEAIVARTRLGCIWNEDETHVAHHSIWNRQTALRLLRAMLKGKDRQTYPVRRPIRVREALAKGIMIGKWVEEWRTADCSWDEKRKLLPDGSTLPWADVEEYTLARKELDHGKREIKKKRVPTTTAAKRKGAGRA